MKNFTLTHPDPAANDILVCRILLKYPKLSVIGGGFHEHFKCMTAIVQCEVSDMEDFATDQHFAGCQWDITTWPDNPAQLSAAPEPENKYLKLQTPSP